jgi:nucleoside-diphosphate-sugar epimerase
MARVAFVTGASGFVGGHVARELHAQGWDVHVLARPTSDLDEISDVPVKLHHGDVTDRASLEATVPKGVDAVFHVAASTNLWSRHNSQQTAINLDGTRNMLATAASAGARRFVHTSSFAAWGLVDGVFTEETPRTETSDWINYVRTKHLSERLVLEAIDSGRIDGVVLNPGNVLGPGDRHNWSRLFRMVQRRALPASPPGGGNFCDVRQVALAHVSAFEKGRSGHRYLLGGEYASYQNVIALAGEIMGLPVPGRILPGWVLAAWAQLSTAAAWFTGREPDVTPEGNALSSHEIRCVSDKAERELGYRSVPVRLMVEDTIAWMKSRGLLQ